MRQKQTDSKKSSSFEQSKSSSRNTPPAPSLNTSHTNKPASRKHGGSIPKQPTVGDREQSIGPQTKQSAKKNGVNTPSGKVVMPTTLLLKSSPPSLPALRKEQPLLLPLGRNMPAKMPLLDAIEQAQHLGFRALQLFFGNPDDWRSPLLPLEIAHFVAQALATAQFASVLIHAPFVIDLASDREKVWISSIQLLQTLLQQARLIGAYGVVVHLNNYKKLFAPVSQVRLARVVKGITYSLSDGPNVPFSQVQLLLENGCSPRLSPGSNIQELGSIFHALPKPYQQHVGVCLDTAHCWAAGYDLGDELIVRKLLQTIESTLGLEHLQVLHLNDAVSGLGSTKDQHAKWGAGQISQRGVSGIRQLLQDPRLAHLTLILETPLTTNEQKQPDWEQEKQHLALVQQLLLTPD